MIKELFREKNGKLSQVRVSSFIALLTAIALSFLAVKFEQASVAMPLVSAWLTAAFVPKVMQKKYEEK